MDEHAVQGPWKELTWRPAGCAVSLLGLRAAHRGAVRVLRAA